MRKQSGTLKLHVSRGKKSNRELAIIILDAEQA